MHLGRLLLKDLRHNFLPHLIAAALLACAAPMVMNISRLSGKYAAQPIEMLLVFIGPILLVPVFMPEQDKNIRDVIRSKRMEYSALCLMRALCSIAAAFVITALFVLAMREHESIVTWQHILGGIASELFLGSLCFAVSGISGSAPAGYMTAIIYYAANVGLKKKLGDLCIFSMYFGMDFSVKYRLLGISAAIILLTLLFVKYSDK